MQKVTTPMNCSSAIVDRPTEQVLSVLKLFYEAEVKGRGMTLDAHKSEPSLQQAAEWMTKPHGKQWLFLSGTVGTGKTTLLRAIRNTLIEFNVTNKMFRASDFPALFFNNVELTERQLLRGEWCRVLLLDDVGVEQVELKEYGNTVKPFVKIIEERYNRMLPLVVSTNLSFADMTTTYGIRTTDRIKEMTHGIKYNFKSFRK